MVAAGVKATADTALFIHQMIPHHENAVNTAKTLLKTGNLDCPDLGDQANPDCVLEAILLEIVAGQNSQIQLMRQFLQDHSYPQSDNCEVYVDTVDDDAVALLAAAAISSQPQGSKSHAVASNVSTVMKTMLLAVTALFGTSMV